MKKLIYTLLIIIILVLVFLYVVGGMSKKNSDSKVTMSSSSSTQIVIPTPNIYEENCPFAVGTSIGQNANSVNTIYNFYVMCPYTDANSMNGPEIALIFYKKNQEEAKISFEKQIGFTVEELRNKNVEVLFYPFSAKEKYINAPSAFTKPLIQKYWK
jgi:hypothetical protein